MDMLNDVRDRLTVAVREARGVRLTADETAELVRYLEDDKSLPPNWWDDQL